MEHERRRGYNFTNYCDVIAFEVTMLKTKAAAECFDVKTGTQPFFLCAMFSNQCQSDADLKIIIRSRKNLRPTFNHPANISSNGLKF
jgi:hypothetical protein